MAMMSLECLRSNPHPEDKISLASLVLDNHNLFN